MEGLVPFILLYAGTTIVQIGVGTWYCYISFQNELIVGRDLKRVTFNHLQTQSLDYFSHDSVGYLVARVMSDTDRIGQLISWGLIDGIWTVIYLIGAFSIMAVLNLRLTLWVAVILPVIVGFSIFFQRHLLFWNRKVREYNSQITGAINEGITGARTTKILVIEEKMSRSFERLTKDMEHASVLASRYRGGFLSVIMLACSVAVSLVLWRGGILSQKELLEIGTLSAFVTYCLNLMEPVQWLVRVIIDLITIQVNIERMTRLMDSVPTVKDSPEVVEKYGDAFAPKEENWEPLMGDIEFRDVSFRYDTDEEEVLTHFSLKIPQGTKVALVGETGAGKSTIVNLACRFYEPNEGQVLIDGRDYRERSQLWLHRNIGYVLQTPHLFSGTVADNLRYGRPEATEEEMWAALELVSARDVVDKLPKGLYSEVGEGGDTLATGEKQLLSFARAVMVDPRIFVLDEATSSIDTLTEQKIQDATAAILKGRTSFMIAHRLSTIRQADLILMIDKGRIVERGTHEELMRAKGAYYDLYTNQFTREKTERVWEGEA